MESAEPNRQPSLLLNGKGYRLILAFGSNIGDRKQNFVTALNLLYEADSSLVIIKQSPYILTSPFQSPLYNTEGHEDYLNFVCEVATLIHPYRFYHDIIVPIEDTIGHMRSEKWAPRALDIDVLLGALNNLNDFVDCSPIILENEIFTLPHKGLLEQERKVLQDLLQDALQIKDENIKCHFKQILCEKN